ncbi:hypothetical protein [Thomasclavelia cocleata]|uniref:hypothetical protein n=1 Tax=Thomasclavelia cocleata TaxID=69824 RepID=UPI002431EBE9|nr:hypothetical protein [Thomasclavelia cocleata]
MRIFLASTFSGMDKETRKKFIQEGSPKYILETFFNGEKVCKNALNDVNRENFLLDSGAFSYMSGAKCTKEDLMKYANSYADFISKNNVKYYFELDVDTIFGIEFVEKIRRDLEMKTGRKCIPVWHKGRGIEYFKWMCDNYSYIAIGGLVFHVKKSEYPLIKKMVDYARSKNVKVHGLGFTKTNELDKYRFYSVDSASWTKAGALGQQRHDFNGRKIVTRKLDNKGKKILLSKLICHNGVEWCKYQRYMDRKGF